MPLRTKYVQVCRARRTKQHHRRAPPRVHEKSPEILAYKGELIGRIEYFLDGKLALVHIPWNEIQSYSDQYNPSMLVLDEMRLVEGVEAGVAIKPTQTAA